MANYTSTHTGATIDASVTIISSSGVTQSDLTKLNAVTSSAVELNLLDGVTASTVEINILDGVTASTTELNYLDGADSSITTLSLPDNTTITTFGASLIDDADAAAARTTLGVDAAGTDNSTDVTLVTTSYDYLSISGQAITLGQIDISDDTNLVGGTGITLTGDTLSTTDSEIVHDNLSGFVSNEHIDHSTVSITAGTGLSGGGDLTSTRTLSTNDSEIVHDNLSGFVANEHIDHSSVSITAGTGLSGGGDITTTRTLTTDDSAIVHDNLSGFVANEHIDHSGVSITAGAGLTGGGDITATRDIAVGAGTGVTVNADDIAIGQDVATSADVTFNSVTADIIGDIRGATKFQAKADVALNKGDAVYISGVSGTTPTVDIADANDSAKMPSFGLAASSVSINASVEIITFGTLSGLNTSSFSVGDIIYISTNGTSGNTLTATAPSGESSLIQNIGIVQRSHASAGSIKVGGAGRTNATPNLDDGDIFIGNGSNQAVTAALNTKIQDYLNTGVNLPSPTFSGDINFTDASTPVLNVTDTTNTVTTKIQSADSAGLVGTSTDHNFNVIRNNVSHILLQSGTIIVNNPGNDLDVNIKDSSANSLFRTDAANSRVGILDSTPSYTLDVNGTGRFTGAVQLDNNLTVTGDLQVNGTTTTVNQTNLDVSDNIIGLNRGASSNANDSGIIIERGSTGDNAAIIFDESADKFTVGTTTSTPSATGNITVTTGTMVANVEGNVTGNVTGDVTGDVTGNADTATALATGRTISLTGDVTGTSASFDGSGNVNLAATIAANSVALGTDTTGNYMSDLTEGTGIDITHTPAEGSNATIILDLTEVGFGGGANRLITDDGDGTVSTESNLTFDGNHLSIASTGRIYLDGGGNTYIFEESADNVIHYVGGQNKLRFNSTGTILNDAGLALDFRVEGDTDDHLFFVDGSADKIGISTNSPQEKLHLKDGNFRVGGDNAGSDYGAIFTPADAASYWHIYNDAGGELVFGRSATIGSLEKMRIDSSGNVGIGTTSPSALLHINEDDNVGAFLVQGGGGGLYLGRFQRDVGGSSYVDIHCGTDDPQITFTTSAAARQFSIGADSSANSFKISENSLVGTNDRFVINDSGFVGIGTSSPEGKVHIYNGDASVAPDSDGDELVVENSGDSGISILSGESNGDSGSLIFGSQNDGNAAGVVWDYYNKILNVKTQNSSGILRFASANNVEAMRIDASQNVGIGTDSPGALLTVRKDGTQASSVSTTYQIQTVSDSNGGIAIQAGGTSSAYLVFGDNANYDAGRIQYNNSNNKMNFWTADTNAMSIDSSQNVGIGTTSPSTKLEVKSTIPVLTLTDNQNKSWTSSDGTLGKLSFKTSDTSGIGVHEIGFISLDCNLSSSTTPNGELVFGTAGVNAVATEKMRIDDSGFVGIGTASPLDLLHIKSSSTDARMVLDGHTGYDAELKFYEAGSSKYTIGHDSASGNFVIGTANVDTNQRLVIDSSGNVGIGTTSPDSKLQVEYTTTSNGSAAIAEFGTSGSGAIANSGHQVIVGGPSVSGYTGMMIYSDSTSGVGQISFADGRGANDSWRGTIAYEHANDRMEFWTNATEKIAINSDGDFIPAGDGTQDLGASSKRWGVIYSADLDLSNEGSQNDVDGTWGSYVIQEGEDDLFLINRRNGKKYKFMLQEVQD